MFLVQSPFSFRQQTAVQPEFSNSSSSEPSGETLVSFTNVLALGDDGWAMLAPYGDHPGMATLPLPDGTVRRFPAIQRIDHQSATEMVNAFHSLTGRIKRWLVGVPIYIGHPDAPGIGGRWADKASKGTIADLEARETGLFCRPVFSNEAVEYLTKTRGVGFSGRWSAKPAGEENGQPIFAPDVLKSAGLTDNPNLPVELLNEASQAEAQQTQTTNIMDKSKLLAWLKTSGIELANDATDAQLEAALAQLTPRLAAALTLENEKTTIAGERDLILSERDALKAQLATLTTERDTAKTDFANERKSRVNLVLDTAILTGRITAAERPAWAGKLETDFANEATAIEKLAPKLKTQSQINDVAARKAEMNNTGPGAEFRGAVQALIAAGKSKSAAVTEAIRTHGEAYAEFRNCGGTL